MRHGSGTAYGRGRSDFSWDRRRDGLDCGRRWRTNLQAGAGVLKLNLHLISVDLERIVDRTGKDEIFSIGDMAGQSDESVGYIDLVRRMKIFSIPHIDGDS